LKKFQVKFISAFAAFLKNLGQKNFSLSGQKPRKKLKIGQKSPHGSPAAQNNPSSANQPKTLKIRPMACDHPSFKLKACWPQSCEACAWFCLG
jgi:hypothetical protein